VQEALNAVRSFLNRVELQLARRLSPQYKVQVSRQLQYLGSNYGGWALDATGLDRQSTIYSFGVGRDISFDLSLINAFGCYVHAFDPTPRSIAWIASQDLPPEFRFHPYGIAAYDGHASFHPPHNPRHVSYSMLPVPQSAGTTVEAPVYTLRTIMNRLGHDRLDLLKMDVEGAEYAVLAQIDLQAIVIKQLLVEFHHRFEGVGWRGTRTAVKRLWQAGFRTAFVSPRGEEFTFVRMESHGR
jgi:FkbM family methyltransferase